MLACHTCLLSCSFQVAEPNSNAADGTVLRLEQNQQVRAGYRLRAAPTCALPVLPWICLQGSDVPQDHLPGLKAAGTGREHIDNLLDLFAMGPGQTLFLVSE